MSSQSAPKLCAACKIREAKVGQTALHHCCACDVYFIVAEHYETHNNRKHQGKGRQLPTAPFSCMDCKKDFYDETVFNSHLAQHQAVRSHVEYSANRGVPTNAKSKKIFICNDCGKDFATKRLRKTHKCSALFHCINAKCGKTCKSLAGLIMHLESGCCGSGVNRDIINRLICERDKKGLITVPGATKLLEAQPVAHSSTESAIEELFDDDESEASWIDAGAMTPTSNFSSDPWDFVYTPQGSDSFDVLSLASWKSDLTPSIVVSEPQVPGKTCSICGKTFKKRKSLLHHLASAVHSPYLYHCKISVLDIPIPHVHKLRTFKSLSGLVQHLEFGSHSDSKTAFLRGVDMLNELAAELGLGKLSGKMAALEASRRDRIKIAQVPSAVV